ncbi:hypothetical protein OX462_10905 [Janthinobacterium sp. SUN098]|uniref:hypothetical protein n=1 Tax=Janthinobacterium sp. SUN098 TaxID=3002437 RepID=UPI0038D39EAE
MRAAALILRTDTGRVIFDSRQAAGGVCLGIFAIPATGKTIIFPGLPRGRMPMVVYGDGQNHVEWSYDETPGYPRFIFPVSSDLPPTSMTTAGVYLK